MRRHLHLTGLALALILSGCSIFGGEEEDESEQPMALTEVQSSIDLKRVLSTKIGDSGENLRLALRPAGDGTRVYVANADGEVTAFDAKTHRKVWSRKLKSKLTSGPGVGEGVVIVAEGNGSVLALDARTGEDLWESNIAAEVLAPSVIAGGRVLLRTVDGRLLALDADDGALLWFVEQPVPRLSQRGTGAPVVSGDAVIAGFDNGRIMGVGLLDGEKLWELPLGIPSGRSDIDRMVDADGAIAAVGNDLYVTGFRARTAAIAAESGQAMWAREFSSYAGLGVDWANVYLTLDNDRILALSRQNGAQEWSNEQLLRRQVTAPVGFGEYAVVGDFEGYLHFLSVGTGLFAGRVRVGNSPIVNRPYVMGNTLYAQSAGGQVVGYQIRTNEKD
ncbi:MAG: outer membrane protein assembly factor BamB [Pseudomonadota bacterium]